ncbi:MAG: TldD/PmbA family protein, partial [Actinomycetota bacterium]|nr:TldD/PmbA family protein [Actinomycetota bacterium]
MEDLLEAALAAAVAAGASYADARSVETTSEALSVRGDVVEALERSDSIGFGVRVLVDGAWGFAASYETSAPVASQTAAAAVEIARATATALSHPVELVPEPPHRATWSSPWEIDPLAVSVEEKVGLLASATAEMAVSPAIRAARGTMDALRQRTVFVSSEGAAIDQTIVHTGAGIEATAVDGAEIQTRSYPGSFRGHL